MSTKDLSILSYKELQALAVKHRVPGNIKKLALVEILHAVKCGNNSEVKRLLTDLKKNRKKRTKRIKTMNTNEDGTLQVQRHDSGSSLQQDHYLFPIQQQHQPQYPFEWVGAEEEVNTSKCEIKYTMNYEDIRHFMFYSSQNLNSSSLIDQIVDLRTEPTITSHCQTTLENGQLDNAKSLSVLLKKMLQAPVGANLSEIASPVSNRSTSNLENYQNHDDMYYSLLRPNRSPSPDTSETMSAKSDIDEEFDLSFGDGVTSATSNVPRILDNDRSFDNSHYRRTNDFKTALDSSVESASLQNYDQQHMYNQYQFNLMPPTDTQDNYKSWFVSNSLGMSNSIDFGAPSTSRLAPTAIQYPSSESADILNTSPRHSSNVIQTQYSVANESLYSNQSTSLLETSDLLPDLQFDSSRLYNSVGLDRTQEPHDFYRQMYVTGDTYNAHYNHQQQQQQQQPQQQQQQQQQQQSSEQATCPDYVQQLAGVGSGATAPIYHIELDNVSYEPGYYQEQQQTTTAPNRTTDPLQQVQDQPYESYVSQPTNYFPNNPPPAYVPAPLDPYWPRWMSNYEREANNAKTNGRSLENTLNLCTPNYVDYTKLNETNCVYSNKTPVMTLRKGLNSVSTELVRSSSAEPRQPNLASNWLLYGEDTQSTRTGQSEDAVVISDQQDTFAANWMLYEQEANNEVKRISTPRVSFERYQADDLGIL